MPTKNENNRQIFYEINGRMAPLGKPIEVSGYPQDVDSDSGSAITNFEEAEIIFNVSRNTARNIRNMIVGLMMDRRPNHLKNNWRKMHHLPMHKKRRKK